jgi:2-octaprenyl-3-methyl-6-methoxy-1,4-benzoquinol hydroxylase
MTQTFDFIVVGAGMVGAAIANGLAARGHHIALIDQGTAPQFSAQDDPDIRVSALSAGSERYLRELGAWGDILAMAATPYRRLAVWEAPEHPVARLLPARPPRTTFSASDLKTPHLGHIVENRVTQKALWDLASRQPTITLYSGAGIQSQADTCDQITATLENGQTVTGRLLIGADGAGSRVRQLAGIGVSRDQYQQQALVASVRYQGTPADITWQAFHSSGPRAFLPLHSAGQAHAGESWASLVWYDDPAVLRELKALSEQDFMARVRAGFPEELPDLTAVAARASFPIARQHAHHYFQGRVVLVGDAAHTINPLAGQGVNLGFQDARCLQLLLDDARRQGLDPAEPQLLAQYEAQRRPANRRMMLTMDAFYHLFSNHRTPLWALRNLGLGLAQGLPFARNQVARYAMGIDESLPVPVQALLRRLPSRWREAG